MRIAAAALLLFASLGPAQAVTQASFPKELRSVWDPSQPCNPKVMSDRDSRFEITSRQRLNYEELETIESADLLTDSPTTWRIVTTSNLGPAELGQPRIYVLQDDLLAVSDGQSARMYIRCK